ncbi:MAG TPA: hypothetical protein VG965_04030 [Patescibacteria group bacterium]|nr:hypothetical protein [Patescibacteria group bacterium]
MNIPQILETLTDLILHFSFEKAKDQSKLVAVVFALVALVVIFFGFVFSLIPQF